MSRARRMLQRIVRQQPRAARWPPRARKLAQVDTSSASADKTAEPNN